MQMQLVETKSSDAFTAEIWKNNDFMMNIVFKTPNGDRIKTVENLPNLGECHRYINDYASQYRVLKG